MESGGSDSNAGRSDADADGEHPLGALLLIISFVHCSDIIVYSITKKKA